MAQPYRKNAVYGSLAYDLDALVRERQLEEAGKLPDYVAASAPDAARDDERLNVSLFAPTGGNITDLTVEGTQFGLGAATWHGIPFYSGTVDLHAGETTTITYTLTTSAEAGDKPLTLRQTPTCRAARDSASA